MAQIPVTRTLADTNNQLANSQRRAMPTPAGIGKMLQFAGAIALIGLGVGIAAAGIGYMASQMKGMGEDGNTLIKILLGLGVTLTILALVGTKIAAPLLFAAAAMAGAMTLISIGIASVASAINVLETDTLTALGNLLNSTGKITVESAEGTLNIGRGMKMIAESADNFDAENIKRITEVFNTVTERRVENAEGPAAPVAPVRPIEIHTTVEMDKDTFGEAVLQVVKNSPELKKVFAGGG